MANWGASDIIKGAEFAWWIYQHGFNDENGADVRYANFQNDVFNFSHLLQRLDEALDKAKERYLRRLPGKQAYDPISQQFEDERKSVIGNFQKTLNDCKAVLEQNKDLRRRHSNAVQNLLWYLKQQEQKVDDLRRRLDFHASKIRMVVDRLMIDLLTDQDAILHDLLGLAEQNLNATNNVMLELRSFRSTVVGHLAGTASLDSAPEEHVASPPIASRFSQSLYHQPPTSITTPPDLPLPETFDALLGHFEQSSDGTDQTPDKYLALLKTRWLLSHIQVSSEYVRARPGFYYKRAVNQIEQAVMLRIRRPGDLVAYEESVLLDLPPSSFRIWPMPDVSITALASEPPPLMGNGNDEKVACINLASDDLTESDTVTVLKSSDDKFRTVRETTYYSAPNRERAVEKMVYAWEHKFIPRYALPTLQQPCKEIAIFSHGMETLYQFNTWEDMWTFQAAFTGYKVAYDHEGSVQCQFSPELSSIDCKGRIQLWQEPIGPSKMEDSAAAPSSPQQGALRSPDHSLQSSRSRHDSLTPSMVTTGTIYRTATGWEADHIKLPAIAIFTQVSPKNKNRSQKDRFCIIFLELVEGIYVDPDRCSCCQDYNTCSKLVIAKKGKGEIPVRASFSDSEDPNAFDLFPFRLPRHPDWDTLFQKTTAFVVIKFKNLDAKIQFHDELDQRIAVRDAQIKMQVKFAQEFALRSDKPQRRPGHPPAGSGPLSSRSSMATITPAVRSSSFASGSTTRAEPTSAQASRSSRNNNTQSPQDTRQERGGSLGTLGVSVSPPEPEKRHLDQRARQQRSPFYHASSPPRDRPNDSAPTSGGRRRFKDIWKQL
jgi:hypothetical protein